MKKVLVAEDEESIREFIVINLTRSGYIVEQAEKNIADNASAKETSAAEPLAEIPLEVPAETGTSTTPDVSDIPEKKDAKVLDLNKPYEEMSVEELQAAILEKLSKNGPVTDQMRKDVADNVYLNSLLNWVKSFQ